MNKLDYDPIEKLSLLAPHAIDWRHIPSDFARTTSADVAAKLAKLPRGASLLGRVKVAGQEQLKSELVYWLKVEMFDTVVKPPAKDVHNLMAHLAIAEVIDPRICRTCKGVGTLVIDSKPISCEDCNGGRYAWSEHSRALACGVHHETWRRTHSRVYVEVLTIPWAWEGELRRALCE